MVTPPKEGEVKGMPVRVWTTYPSLCRSSCLPEGLLLNGMGIDARPICAVPRSAARLADDAPTSCLQTRAWLMLQHVGDETLVPHRASCAPARGVELAGDVRMSFHDAAARDFGRPAIVEMT